MLQIWAGPKENHAVRLGQQCSSSLLSNHFWFNYFLSSQELPPKDHLFTYGMVILGFMLLWFAVSLAVKRKERIEIQKQRWKDIKELEEDYDVYVSDEYAYHIADNKLQMH